MLFFPDEISVDENNGATAVLDTDPLVHKSDEKLLQKIHENKEKVVKVETAEFGLEVAEVNDTFLLPEAPLEESASKVNSFESSSQIFSEESMNDANDSHDEMVTIQIPQEPAEPAEP